jgi:hypothetical protein
MKALSRSVPFGMCLAHTDLVAGLHRSTAWRLVVPLFGGFG